MDIKLAQWSAEVIVMPSIISRNIFAILLFNGLIFGTAMFKDDIAKAIESVKAIAWYISASVCEVNNFCHEIKNDQTGYKYISSNLVMDSSIYGKYSNIKTSNGDYVVQGDVKEHRAGSIVTLKATSNQLCVDTICYLVPNK